MKTKAWQETKALEHGSGRRGRRTRARAGGDSQGHAARWEWRARGTDLGPTDSANSRRGTCDSCARKTKRWDDGWSRTSGGEGSRRTREGKRRKEADGGIIYDGIYWSSWVLGRIRSAWRVGRAAPTRPDPSREAQNWKEPSKPCKINHFMRVRITRGVETPSVCRSEYSV